MTKVKARWLAFGALTIPTLLFTFANLLSEESVSVQYAIQGLIFWFYFAFLAIAMGVIEDEVR